MDAETLDLNFCILAQPKAGSTWLVHLLSSFIDENYAFSDLEKYIPITRKKIPYRVHSPAPVPNVKNLQIIRNPFDSCVSWRNYLELKGSSSSSLPDFSKYYSPSEDIYLIRYEDLNMHTFTTLYNVVYYLGWKPDMKTVEEVINKCKLENLSGYEQETLEKEGKFLFYDPISQIKDNKRFYNQGKCYTFKDKLTPKEIQNIKNKYKKALDRYWPELRNV